MPKNLDLDPHEIYCSVVDAVEAGEPFVLSHQQRGVFPQVAALAVIGAENATAQLNIPEFSMDPAARQHLVAVIAAKELVDWYATDAPLARAHQQAENRDFSSDLQPADTTVLSVQHDMDGSQSFSAHTLGNSLPPKVR